MSFRILYITAAVLLAVGTGVCRAGAGEDGRIRPCERNRYYWQYKGRPVLLLGGSVEDNLFQIRDLSAHLDVLKAAGGNYVRNTMSCRDAGDAWPFAKVGDEYDLTQWNEEFWRRFKTFLAETAKRDIIVQIEIWATFDYYRDIWERNPFNPKNNRTYTAAESGLPTAVKTHPTRTGNDFFRSVPGAKDLAVVLKHQQRFVRRILAESLQHDHVLYTMDNETSVTPKWGAYWATFIRREAERAGKRVETTEMWDKWDLSAPMHRATFDHPEIYTFIDISQNNHQKGQTHHDNAVKQRRRIAKQPRPMNNVKIYGADGGRFGDTRDGIERFWRNIFAGLASARFHRPASGIGLSSRAQRMIRSARDVTDAFDIFTCEPRNDLLSGRKANEAYCLADPPRQYAVYFPAPGRVTLEAKAAKGGKLMLRWYDIDRGRWRAQAKVDARAVDLVTPDKGQWAAVIQ